MLPLFFGGEVCGKTGHDTAEKSGDSSGSGVALWADLY